MVPPENSEQALWFAKEVHPHEASLKAYLRRSFPGIRDFDDLVQDSYLRIWKARAVHQIDCARAFLFTVAKRLAITRLQRERNSPIDAVQDYSSLTVRGEGPTAAEVTCTRDEILLLAEGIAGLPPRCREVFVLRKIEGLSQKEIAAKLGISEQTVQVQVLRGARRCEVFLRRRGMLR